MNTTPRPNVIKRFTFVVYECSLLARVFVLVKPLWPSLMLMGNFEAYLSETPFQVLQSRVGFGLCSQTLDWAGKA